MKGDRPAPRLHGYHIARCQPQRQQVGTAQRGRGQGFDGIEHGSSPRHAAGVPVLELTPRDEHERVVGVGPFVGRNDVGRDQVHTSVVGGKVVDEHGGRTGVVFAQAGIGHAGLALQPLPADARDRGMHGLTHLLVDCGHAIVRTCVIPVQPHAAGELLDDPQIGSCITGRIDRLPAHLYHAVGVGDGAGLFRPGGGRQHHIGQPGGLGHEDVLHHQMLQAGQRMARVVQVGVAHGRVFAHDVHAAHLVRVALGRQRLVHDFNDGVTGFFVEFRVPEVLEPLVRGRVVHPLVVGKHHGDQAGVAGALHVVLAAQRVQAGAGLADLPGHGGQGDQATRVVGAVDMLADAHAPQNHGSFGLRKRTGNLAQGPGRNPANRRHGLGAVSLDVFPERFVIAGAPVDEVLVHQALLDHRMDQCIEHGHVGVGLELQRAPGVPADIGDARIGQHDPGALLRGIFHPGGGHGMVGRGIGADHKYQVGMRNVVDLVAHRRRAHALQQGRHAGGMAQPRAVVHVVGAEAGAHQLLEQVSLFVAALGRAKTGQRLAAITIAQAPEPAGRQTQRLFPARFAKYL